MCIFVPHHVISSAVQLIVSDMVTQVLIQTETIKNTFKY